jgi:hypothetical protein
VDQVGHREISLDDEAEFTAMQTFRLPNRLFDLAQYSFRKGAQHPPIREKNVTQESA